MAHPASDRHGSDTLPIIPWIVGGIVGLGLPALSITLTYGVLIHVPKIGSLVQRVGHPLLALLPSLFAAIVACMLAGTFFAAQRPARILLSMVGIGGIVATVVALWLQVLVLRPGFAVKQIPFDAKVWQDAGCGTSRARQMMVTSLVQEIRGMTPQQITALLGQNEVGEASYCLGPEAAAIPTDRLTLRVLYDARGQAADVRISAN